MALDPSPQELAASPQGSYDEVVIGDVTDALPALAGRFDLVVSWQVLEHVRPMEKAVANLRTFLRPGGHLVAQVSGRYSAFAILNMASPHQVSTRAMQGLLGRAPETVFRAHYDHCTYSSGAQISAVVEGDRRPVGDGRVGDLTQELQEIYFGAVRGENPKYEDWGIPVY